MNTRIESRRTSEVVIMKSVKLVRAIQPHIEVVEIDIARIRASNAFDPSTITNGL